MGTILLFNDDSIEAVNATEFALSIAIEVQADLLILNLCKRRSKQEAISIRTEKPDQKTVNGINR